MKRKRLHEISLETDIKYVGPLSEREFRILGWVCLAFAQIAILMQTGQSMNPALAVRFNKVGAIVTTLSSMALPFLLIANFAAILNNREEYKRQILVNLTFLVLFGGLFLLVFYHYGVGLVAIIANNRAEALRAIKEALADTHGKKYISFNIFVDLFLCSLISFFMFYRPKKALKKWEYVLFRLAVILPIGYEAGTIYLKYLAHVSRVIIPIWLYPALPVKPPMTFFLFIILAIFMKTREIRFCKYGRSYDEYQLFLQTRRNSLHFSIFASISAFLAGIVDTAIYAIFTVTEIEKMGIGASAIDTFTPVINKLGFGESIGLIFFAPILLLFSYNKKTASKTVMALIPVAGVVLIILIYLQGAYQLLNQLPVFLSDKLSILM